MQRLLIITIVSSLLASGATAWSQQNRPVASVPQLSQALSSDDAQRRAAAARELWRRGAESAPAIDALTRALKDEDPLVRAYSARAVGDSQAAHREAVTGLSELLFDDDQRVRASAAEAIRAVLPEPQVIGGSALQALASDDARLVEPLVEVLVAGGKQSVPLLVEALHNKDTRFWAALILAELGPDAAPAIPALLQTLSDERPEVQLQALVALGQIGAPAGAAATAINRFLQPETPLGLQYAAAFALANIGSDDSLPALKQLRDSHDPFLRTIAAWGIASVDDDPQTVRECVAILVESLQSTDRRVRQSAARALAELELDRELVQEKLFAALEDADPTVRANIADAIASLGPTTVERLTEGLQQPAGRELAVEVLQRLGPSARAAQPALVELIQQLHASGEDDLLLANALVALAVVGDPPIEIQPLLAKQFEHAEPVVRRAAIYVAGKQGPRAKELKPALREAAQLPDEQTRMVAVWAMLQIDPADDRIAEAAVPLLTAALRSDRELVRVEAATALGTLGKRAQSSAAALRALLNDPSPEVRSAAEEALSSIGDN